MGAPILLRSSEVYHVHGWLECVKGRWTATTLPNWDNQPLAPQEYTFCDVNPLCVPLLSSNRTLIQPAAQCVVWGSSWNQLWAERPGLQFCSLDALDASRRIFSIILSHNSGSFAFWTSRSLQDRFPSCCRQDTFWMMRSVDGIAAYTRCKPVLAALYVNVEWGVGGNDSALQQCLAWDFGEESAINTSAS
jgi:hypothetical protein